MPHSSFDTCMLALLSLLAQPPMLLCPQTPHHKGDIPKHMHPLLTQGS